MAEEPPRGSYAIKYVCKVCMEIPEIACLSILGEWTSIRSFRDPTMGNKSAEKIGSKIWFLSILETFSPPPSPPVNVEKHHFLKSVSTNFVASSSFNN